MCKKILITILVGIGYSSLWTYNYNGKHWDINLVDYCIDSSVPEDWIPAIQKADSVWSSVGAIGDTTIIISSFGFKYSSYSPNVIRYGNVPGGNVALTQRFYVGDIIIKCITTLSDAVEWSVDSICPPDKYDVWNVMAHEFGHWLELLDVEDTNTTMYSEIKQGEIRKRSLHPDDKEGIKDIYLWPAQYFLFYEGFEREFPPPDWRVIGNNVDAYTWHKETNILTAYRDSGYASIYNHPRVPSNEWLITPNIWLEEGDIDRVVLTFYLLKYPFVDRGKLYIKVYDPNDWNWEVQDTIEKGRAVGNQGNRDWQKYVIDLTPYRRRTGIKIAFQYKADPSFKNDRVCVDDISIMGDKSCGCGCLKLLKEKGYDDILFTLRRFRDQVLERTSVGEEYIKLYYEHSLKVARIVLLDKELRTKTIELLKKYVPSINYLLDRENVPLTNKLGLKELKEIEYISRKIQEKADPILKKELEPFVELGSVCIKYIPMVQNFLESGKDIEPVIEMIKEELSLEAKEELYKIREMLGVLDEELLFSLFKTEISVEEKEIGREDIVLHLSPNPSFSWVEIKFFLPKEENVVLSIYDVSGKLVKNLINKKCSSGLHNVRWDSKDNISGVYFAVLKVGKFLQSKKLILLR
jgi:hypothetical protein